MQLQAPASRLAATLLLAQSNLRLLLSSNLPGVTGPFGWGVAMVLALWYWRKKDPELSRISSNPELKVGSLLDQLDSFSAFLPSELTTAIVESAKADSPDAGDPKIAGAAVYLGKALSGNSRVEELVLRWLRGQQFVEAAQALMRAYPYAEAGSAQPSVTTSVVVPATAKQLTRAQRFDGWRPRRQASVTATPYVPMADLMTPNETAKATLVSMGWQETEADRVLSGPEAATRTAVQVFRRYLGLDEAEQAKLITNLTKRGVFDGPSRVDVGHLLANVEPQSGYVSALDAYKGYASLSKTEQDNFVALLLTTSKA